MVMMSMFPCSTSMSTPLMLRFIYLIRVIIRTWVALILYHRIFCQWLPWLIDLRIQIRICWQNLFLGLQSLILVISINHFICRSSHLQLSISCIFVWYQLSWNFMISIVNRIHQVFIYIFFIWNLWRWICSMNSIFIGRWFFLFNQAKINAQISNLSVFIVYCYVMVQVIWIEILENEYCITNKFFSSKKRFVIHRKFNLALLLNVFKDKSFIPLWILSLWLLCLLFFFTHFYFNKHCHLKERCFWNSNMSINDLDN